MWKAVLQLTFYDPTKIAYISIAIRMCMHRNVLSAKRMFRPIRLLLPVSRLMRRSSGNVRVRVRLFIPRGEHSDSAFVAANKKKKKNYQ